MKTLWNEADRSALISRIERVEASSRARWGSFTPERMLAHLVQSMKMAVGELPTASKKLPLRFFPLKQLVIYAIPFPRGAPTAPELLAGGGPPVGESKAELRRLLALFAGMQGSARWPEHPAFGRLTPKDWGALTHKHIDHHLRQFAT
jgi:Protein of unknown function (DUF1569)